MFAASLYTPSKRTLSALAAPAAPVAAPVAFSVQEPVNTLRSSFAAGRRINVPAAAEGGKIAMYSPEFYAACTVGGILSCGATHTAVTPLDIVKCNMQVDPARFKSIPGGFSLILKEQGAGGLFKGWAPTAIGYSAQGAFKFGFYEYFKKCARPATQAWPRLRCAERSVDGAERCRPRRAARWLPATRAQEPCPCRAPAASLLPCARSARDLGNGSRMQDLWRHGGPGERRQVPDAHLPGWQRVRRVLG